MRTRQPIDGRYTSAKVAYCQNPKHANKARVKRAAAGKEAVIRRMISKTAAKTMSAQKILWAWAASRGLAEGKTTRNPFQAPRIMGLKRRRSEERRVGKEGRSR